MRWKALYIIAGLAIVFTLIGVCFGSFIVKWSLENTMEAMTGAQVDLSRVNLDLLNLAVSIGDLQVANPRNTWRNLLQAKDVRFRVEPGPLFYGKTIIEEIAMEELMLNTPRKTDGKLNRPLLPGPFGEAQAKLQKNIAAMPVLRAGDMAGQFNVEALMKKYAFQVDLSAVDIKSRIDALETRWETAEADLDTIKIVLKQNQEKLETLKSGDLKDPLEIKRKLDVIKEVRQSLKEVEKKVRVTRDGFQNDLAAIRSTIQNMKEVADGDYQKIIKMANVPNPKEMDITEALLGKEFLNQSSIVLDLVARLQAMVPVRFVSPPKEEHPRGGQDIIYPGRKTYPRLLIKKIYVSGRGNHGTAMDGYAAQATVEGITSEPPLYGKPLFMTVNGQSPNRSRLHFTGSVDRTRPNYRDDFGLELSGLPVPDLPMPTDNKYLPTFIRVKSANVEAALTLSRSAFQLNLRIDGRDLMGDYTGRPEAEDLIQEIIREAMAEFDLVTLNYRLSGVGKDLDMEIHSNLDDVLRARIKEVIGRKLEEFVNKVREKVNAKLREKQEELNAKLDKGRMDLEAKLTEMQDKLKFQSEELDEQKKRLDEALAKTKRKIEIPKIKF